MTMVEPYSYLNSYDEIVTYCAWRDEEASARAAKKLIDAGYTNVKTIEGGLTAWEKAGFPVTETPQEG